MPTPHGDVSPNGLRRIYRVLVHLASGGGRVGEDERLLLDGFCEDHTITPKEARTLEREATEQGLISVGKRPAERELLIERALELIAADGVLDEDERLTLRKLADFLERDFAELEQRVEAYCAGFDLIDEDEPEDEQSAPALDDEASARPSAPKGSKARGRRRIYRILHYVAAAGEGEEPIIEGLLDSLPLKLGLESGDAAKLAREGRAGKKLKLGEAEGEHEDLYRRIIELCTSGAVLTRDRARRVRKFTKPLGIEGRQVVKDLSDGGLELGDVRTVFVKASKAKLLKAKPVRREPESEDKQDGRALLINAEGKRVAIDAVPVDTDALSERFLGFRALRHGWHRIEVDEARAWIRVGSGKPPALAYVHGELVDAGDSSAKLISAARSGMADPNLFPASVPADMRPIIERLHGPIDSLSEPPTVHANPDPSDMIGGPLQYTFVYKHRAKPASFLAELAFVFLDGVIDVEGKTSHAEITPHMGQSLRRWHHLLQCLFIAEEGPIRAYPELFLEGVDLLMAQLTVFTNPASNVMAMARNLGAEMSEEDGKVEAMGLRWLTFLKDAGY